MVWVGWCLSLLVYCWFGVLWWIYVACVCVCDCYGFDGVGCGVLLSGVIGSFARLFADCLCLWVGCFGCLVLVMFSYLYGL